MMYKVKYILGALDSGTVVTGTVKDITGSSSTPPAGGQYILSTSVATSTQK